MVKFIESSSLVFTDLLIIFVRLFCVCRYFVCVCVWFVCFQFCYLSSFECLYDKDAKQIANSVRLHADRSRNENGFFFIKQFDDGKKH